MLLVVDLTGGGGGERKGLEKYKKKLEHYYIRMDFWQQYPLMNSFPELIFLTKNYEFINYTHSQLKLLHKLN